MQFYRKNRILQLNVFIFIQREYYIQLSQVSSSEEESIYFEKLDETLSKRELQTRKWPRWQARAKGRQEDEGTQPELGLHFVLYNEQMDVVEANTGILPVDDRINRIQDLSSDKFVIQESGYLEVSRGS